MFFANNFCSLFVFLIVIYHAEGYSSINKAVVHRSKPGKCYDDSTKR